MQAYGLEPQVVLTVALPREPGTGSKMSASLGNYIGARRGAGGAVRKDDADPGLAARAVVPAGHGAAAARGRPARGQARAGAVHRRPLARGGGGRRAPRSTSRASCASARRPDDVPEVQLPDGDPVHLPALLAESLGIGSTSEARRLIAQGGVRVNGEVVSRAGRAPRDPRGSACSSGKAPLRPLDSGLDVATIPGLPGRVAWKVPVTATNGAPSERTDTNRKFGFSWGLWCESEAFLRVTR